MCYRAKARMRKLSMCAALDRVLTMGTSGCAIERDSSFTTQEVASDVW